MAKPKWGSKRRCNNCGARFYDLNRAAVACPKCGTPYGSGALPKSRRQRQAPTEENMVPLVPDEIPVEVETEEAHPAEAVVVLVRSPHRAYDDCLRVGTPSCLRRSVG
ncbi:MAG: TIGR02300 family protein [Proteobacteria bacterium]|nr:TIGR02300 family protein [Pseudomonadota bacterium]